MSEYLEQFIKELNERPKKRRPKARRAKLLDNERSDKLASKKQH